MLFPVLLILAVITGVRWYLNAVLMCISLMANDDEPFFFHVSDSHLYVFIGEVSLHIFCPFLKYDCLFCVCWVWGVLYRSWISTICLSCHLQVSSRNPWVALCFVDCFLCYAEGLDFDEVPEVYFGFCSLSLWRHILKEVAVADIEEITAYILLYDSDGFCLTLRSFIHFEFIFVCGVRQWSSFILLRIVAQFPLHHLWKRLSFFHCIFFPVLSKIIWP